MNKGKLFLTNSCIKLINAEAFIWYRCLKFAFMLDSLNNLRLQKLLKTQRASPILLYFIANFETTIYRYGMRHSFKKYILMSGSKKYAAQCLSITFMQ
ncbi:LOW QUALITY PROTEIN: hypothetical protein HZS_2474 [Henneguya salminicola]|nr:LOW QUALITY PROTEIN: hypothetical protein HZS_2474 [Henneguya salminicola]